MPGVVISEADEAAIAAALDKEGDMEPSVGKTLRKLQRKIANAKKRNAARNGLSLPKAEAVLLQFPKYARFVGGNPFALATRLRNSQATLDQLESVGRFCEGQHWLKTFDLTMMLNNWTSWLSRAAATASKAEATGYFTGPAGFEDE